MKHKDVYFKICEFFISNSYPSDILLNEYSRSQQRQLIFAWIVPMMRLKAYLVQLCAALRSKSKK